MALRRSDEENQVFAARAAEWSSSWLPRLVAGISEYALATGRGQPPKARVYLRQVPEFLEAIALEALTAIILGTVHDDSLTSIAGKIGKAVVKVTGVAAEDDKQAMGVGFVLIGLICDITGACAIAAKHGDRPNKVDGGVKVSPSYELAIKDGSFLEIAAEFGSLGMPTYVMEAPSPWINQGQDAAGEYHDGGMVHSAGGAMKGVTHNSAPDLFAAVNAAMQATFRVNPFTGAIITTYDPVKAQAWLTSHFVANGMPQVAAERAAREAARL